MWWDSMSGSLWRKWFPSYEPRSGAHYTGPKNTVEGLQHKAQCVCFTWQQLAPKVPDSSCPPPPASFWEFLLHIFFEGLSMKIYWNLSGGTHTLWTLMLCNVTEMKSCRYHRILHPILARKVDSKAHALGSSFQVLDVPHPFLWSYCDD